MKTSFLFVPFLAVSFFTSCCSGECKKEKKETTTTTPAIAPVAAAPVIFDTTIVSKKGESFRITYTTDEQATINFNGEKAELTRQRTASGVKFSNDHFEYNEWQGEITLAKDGKTIFSNK